LQVLQVDGDLGAIGFKLNRRVTRQREVQSDLLDGRSKRGLNVRELAF